MMTWQFTDDIIAENDLDSRKAMRDNNWKLYIKNTLIGDKIPYACITAIDDAVNKLRTNTIDTVKYALKSYIEQIESWKNNWNKCMPINEIYDLIDTVTDELTNRKY